MASSGKGRTLLFLFLLWLIYLIIGVFIFRAVEHDDDKTPEKTKDQSMETIKNQITTKYNVSEEEFNNIVQQIQAASSSSSAGPEWSYPETMSFVIQLVTTIGYGNITPVTTGGRVLCIFFALFGIPINLLFLQLIGERMLRGEQLLITELETSCLKRQSAPKYLNEKCSLLGFVLLLIILVAGAGCQMEIDNWTFFEGFYAYFITFTTVGFGDLIPGTNATESQAANISIRVIFIVMGLAAMSNVINGLVNCTDYQEWFSMLNARCGRKRNVDVSETKENREIELSE